MALSEIARSAAGMVALAAIPRHAVYEDTVHALVFGNERQYLTTWMRLGRVWSCRSRDLGIRSVIRSLMYASLSTGLSWHDELIWTVTEDRISLSSLPLGSLDEHSHSGLFVGQQ